MEQPQDTFETPTIIVDTETLLQNVMTAIENDTLDETTARKYDDDLVFNEETMSSMGILSTHYLERINEARGILKVFFS